MCRIKVLYQKEQSLRVFFGKEIAIDIVNNVLKKIRVAHHGGKEILLEVRVKLGD
jgi:hypothetical protein